MSSWTSTWHGILSRVVPVQREEVQPLVLSFASLYCVLGSYFLLLPLREEAGMSLGTAMLPTLFITSLAVTLLVAPVTSAWLAQPTQAERGRALQRLFVVLAAILLVFYLLYCSPGAHPAPAAAPAADGALPGLAAADRPPAAAAEQLPQTGLLPTVQTQRKLLARRLDPPGTPPQPGSARGLQRQGQEPQGSVVVRGQVPEGRQRMTLHVGQGTADQGGGPFGPGMGFGGTSHSFAEWTTTSGGSSSSSSAEAGMQDADIIAVPSSRSRRAGGPLSSSGLTADTSDSSSGTTIGFSHADAALHQQEAAAGQVLQVLHTHPTEAAASSSSKSTAWPPVDHTAAGTGGLEIALENGSSSGSKRRQVLAMNTDAATTTTTTSSSSSSSSGSRAGGATEAAAGQQSLTSSIDQLSDSQVKPQRRRGLKGGLAPIKMSKMQYFLRATFYVWVNVMNLVGMSSLWARCADVFPPDSGARLFGCISAGATLGQLSGSLLAVAVSRAATARSLSQHPSSTKGHSSSAASSASFLIVLAVVLQLAAAVLAPKIRRPAGRWSVGGTAKWHGHDKEETPLATTPKHSRGGLQRQLHQLSSGFRMIWSSPYLIATCGYLLLTYVVGSLLYFQRNLVVAAAVTSTSDRTAFFAVLNSWSASIIAALQLVATSSMLQALGVPAALVLGPVICLGGCAMICWWPVPSSVVGFEVLRKVYGYAVSRPAREVLFTVVSPEEKYRAKVVMDTVVQRCGDALAAALFQLLEVQWQLGSGVVGAVCCAVCCGWGVLAWQLGMMHVSKARAAARIGTEHRL